MQPNPAEGEAKATETEEPEWVREGNVKLLDESDVLVYLQENRAAVEKTLNRKEELHQLNESDFWRPSQIGEYIEGVYLGSALGTNGYPGVHLACRKADGSKGVWHRTALGATMILNALQGVMVGTSIRIVYNGMGKNSRNQKTHRFAVFAAK